MPRRRASSMTSPRSDPHEPLSWFAYIMGKAEEPERLCIEVRKDPYLNECRDWLKARGLYSSTSEAAKPDVRFSSDRIAFAEALIMQRHNTGLTWDELLRCHTPADGRRVRRRTTAVEAEAPLVLEDVPLAATVDLRKLPMTVNCLPEILPLRATAVQFFQRCGELQVPSGFMQASCQMYDIFEYCIFVNNCLRLQI